MEGATLRLVQQETTYAQQEFDLTTSWQQYTWCFIAQEDFLRLRLNFPNAGIFLFDGINIPALIEAVDTADALTLDPNMRYQTMEGFGSTLAFYENWIPAHPNKEELYQLVFQDLGLDWLRLRNIYGRENTSEQFAAEFVQKANAYTEDSVRVLMCSWSPPAELKSNNNTNTGTLKKVNGEFVYGEFGEYWRNALQSYAALGVEPDWISIQNEPDYETVNWETTRFAPTETDQYAGYDQALDAVYQSIKDLPNVPKMLGAETLGLGYNSFDNYSQPIQDKDHLWGYAYHLYSGGDAERPDSYNAVLNNIQENYGGRPNVMTEYENYEAGWLNTAWLVSNVLTEANTSAYFYRDMIWPDKGLIDIDNPWNTESWENEKGYTINPHYYAFKHFSKHVKLGYQRVGGENTNNGLRTSAFLSPDERELVMVLINTASAMITSSIAIPGDWIMGDAEVYQSVEDNFYQQLGGLDSGKVALPARSVTTVVMQVTGPDAVVAGRSFSIFARHSGKALTVHQGSQRNGKDVRQFTYDDENYQQWRLEDAGNGYFKLVAAHSGKVLTIDKASKKDGAKAEQWLYMGTKNQQWTLKDAGDGYYALIAAHSDKALTVARSHTKDNAKVVQQTFTGSENQQWLFKRVEVEDAVPEDNLKDRIEAVIKKVLKVYPNPSFSGLCTIELSGYEAHEKLQVSIINYRGEQVYTREINTTQLNLTQMLNAGIYIIKVTSKDEVVTGRLLVF